MYVFSQGPVPSSPKVQYHLHPRSSTIFTQGPVPSSPKVQYHLHPRSSKIFYKSNDCKTFNLSKVSTLVCCPKIVRDEGVANLQQKGWWLITKYRVFLELLVTVIISRKKAYTKRPPRNRIMPSLGASVPFFKFAVLRYTHGSNKWICMQVAISFKWCDSMYQVFYDAGAFAGDHQPDCVMT